jgi:hypothetical protein
MTKEESNQTPRPGDPFTAQDGARLFGEFNAIAEGMRRDIATIKGAVATLQNQHLTILEALGEISRGLSSSRFDRLAVEIRDAELELEVAEKNLKAKEEKLEKKKEIKDHTIDTQDRFKTVASSTYEEIEEGKKRARQAKIDDLKFSALKAVITWGSVGAVALVFSFIWFLIQQYINRGSP